MTVETVQRRKDNKERISMEETLILLNFRVFNLCYAEVKDEQTKLIQQEE